MAQVFIPVEGVDVECVYLRAVHGELLELWLEGDGYHVYIRRRTADNESNNIADTVAGADGDTRRDERSHEEEAEGKLWKMQLWQWPASLPLPLPTE